VVLGSLLLPDPVSSLGFVAAARALTSPKDFFLLCLDGSFDGELICLLFVLKRSGSAVEV
jgi:hypothetical protein